MDKDTYLTQLYPHMHVRGKDVQYKIIYPDGREEVVLSVPKYDFNWQTSYRLAEPKFMPKGSTLMVIAHFDNSTGNRYNPDPEQRSALGRSDVGRDADRLLQHDGCASEPSGADRSSAAVAIYDLTIDNLRMRNSSRPALQKGAGLFFS